MFERFKSKLQVTQFITEIQIDLFGIWGGVLMRKKYRHH